MTSKLSQSSSLLADLNEMLPTSLFCCDSIGSPLIVELFLAVHWLTVGVLLTGDVSFDV